MKNKKTREEQQAYLNRLICETEMVHNVIISRIEDISDHMSTSNSIGLVVTNYGLTEFEPRDFVSVIDLKLLVWQFKHKINSEDCLTVWCANETEVDDGSY